MVEDEGAMRELIRQGLEESNHTVTVARDGMDLSDDARQRGADAAVAFPGPLDDRPGHRS